MPAWMIGVGVTVLAASSFRLVVEHSRGVVHAESDLLSLFIPTFAGWWTRFRGLAGWNPFVFGGVPASADPQVGALHPLGLLYGVCDPLTAATIDGVLTPALGGIGMLLYLHALGCGWVGVAIGALSFALGGFFTGHAPNPGLMRAAMVIPWALAAIEVLEGRTLIAGLGATVGLLILSGHPQGVIYGMVPIALYAVVFNWRTPRRSLLMVGALALAACLSAGMLLPAAELVRLSSRAFGEMTGHANPKLSLVAATGLFVPFPGGGAIGPLYGRSFQAPFGCDLVECSGYSGTLPLLAVLAALPVLVRESRGRFWLLLAFAGVALATGVFGSGGATLRAPVRFLLWWNLAIPIAAGLALGDGRRRPTRAAWLSAMLILTALLGLTWFFDAASRRVVSGSFVVLGVAALMIALANGGSRARWLLVGFVAVEMAAYVGSMPFGVRPETYRKALAATSSLHAATNRSSNDGDQSPERSLVVPTLRHADWAPFSGTLLLQGYNSLLPARSPALLTDHPGAALAEIGWVDDASLVEPSSHVLDVLRAGIVGVPHGAALPLARTLAARTERGDERWERASPDTSGKWLLYRNRRALPLAWMVFAARVAPPDVTARLLREDTRQDFDPATQALVAAPVLGLTEKPPSPAPRSSVRTVAFGDDTIRLSVDTASAGLLVTSEIHYPGWTVEVDGQSSPMVIVNSGFRATALERGHHDVVFAYRPWRVRVGMAISAVASIVLIALVWSDRRRRSA